jgi:hypothetical protein
MRGLGELPDLAKAADELDRLCSSGSGAAKEEVGDERAEGGGEEETETETEGTEEELEEAETEAAAGAPSAAAATEGGTWS